MKEKLKVALYGLYGHQLHRSLNDSENAEIVAVCGLGSFFTNEIRQTFGEGVKEYSSLCEMLKDENIELVSLCSPDRSKQADEAIMCLKAGKHVYAEKPAAYTEEDLDRILAVSRESKREFHEMADSVFEEPYWSARKAVREGKIGKVVQVYVQKSYPLNVDSRPQNEYKDGGLIRQVGIHAIRFLEHITGLSVEKVNVFQTHLGNIDENAGLFTASSWNMTLSNGGVASACVNYLNPNGFISRGNESIRIFGTEGMLEITDGGKHTHIYTQNADEGELDLYKSDCPDFFDLLAMHLKEGKKMPMTLDEELHPLRVCIRAYESAKVTEKI